MEQPTWIQTATRLRRCACRWNAPMRMAGGRQLRCLAGALVILTLALAACRADSAEESAGATSTPPAPPPTAAATAIWTAANGPESGNFPVYPSALTVEQIELSVDQGGGVYTYEQVSQATGSEADIDVQLLVRNRYQSMQNTGIDIGSVQFMLVSWGEGNNFRWDVIPVDGSGNLQYWLQFRDEITGEWRYAEQPGYDSLLKENTEVRWSRLEGNNWRVGLEQATDTFLVPVQVEDGKIAGWLKTPTGEFISFAVEQVAATVEATEEPTVEPPTPEPTVATELTVEEQWEVDMRETLDASGMEVTCAYVGTRQQIIPEDLPGKDKICYMYGNSRGDMQVLSPENEKLGTARLLATHINHVLGRIDGQALPEEWDESMGRYRNADGTVKSVDEIVEQAISDGFTLNLPRIERDASGNFVLGILEGASFLNTRYQIGYDYVSGSRADSPVLDGRGIFSAAYSSGGFYIDQNGLVVVLEFYISPNDSLIAGRTYYASITDYAIRTGDMLASNSFRPHQISYLINWVGGESGPWLEVLGRFVSTKLFQSWKVNDWYSDAREPQSELADALIASESE